MEEIESLQKKLAQFYAQPYSPRSVAEAISWEADSGMHLVSCQEAEAVKAQLREAFGQKEKTQGE